MSSLTSTGVWSICQLLRFLNRICNKYCFPYVTISLIFSLMTSRTHEVDSTLKNSNPIIAPLSLTTWSARGHTESSQQVAWMPGHQTIDIARINSHHFSKDIAAWCTPEVGHFIGQQRDMSLSNFNYQISLSNTCNPQFYVFHEMLGYVNKPMSMHCLSSCTNGLVWQGEWMDRCILIIFTHR